MSNIGDLDKLLIVTSPALSAVDYLCLVTLLEARKNKPHTDVVISQSQIDKYTPLAAFPLSDKIQIIQSVTPRRYVLSFAKGDTKVKNVQWNQSEKDISLYISMDEGSFSPSGMNFQVLGADYGAIVYWNLKSFAEVSKVFDPYKNIVNEVKNISFGSELGIDNQQVEVIVDSKHSTLAETTYAHIKTPLTKDGLTQLIAAVLIQTDRFRKGINSSNVFHMLARSVEAGGDLTLASATADKAQEAKKTVSSPTTASLK